MLFGFGPEADFKNSSMNMAYASQGGLGLPDTTYYTDAKKADKLKAYQAHVAKVLELSGVGSPALLQSFGIPLVHAQPQIQRISLAVMVDGTEVKGADGKLVWQPRPAEELARIAQLVRSAVGYDAKRGDKVDVVSMRFAGDQDVAPPPPPGLFGVSFDKADLMHLAQNALLGLVGMVALLFVFRPMVHRLTALAPAALPGGGGPVAALGGYAGGGRGEGVPMLAGPDGQAAFSEEEDLVNVGNIEGQLRASSIRRLVELVDKHPEESLSIVRAWMQEGTT